MSLLTTAISYLVYILIFPGFLFCFILGILLTGIIRKLVARMQRRIGPPVLQPLYDVLKLFGKETIVPASAVKSVFLYAPLVGFASLIVLQLFVPVCGFTAFSGSADMIVILYLLLIPALAEIVGGSSSGSPYASVGVSREMVMIISCELPLILVLLAVAKETGNLVGGGLVLSLDAIASAQMRFGCLIARPSMIPAAIAFLMVIPGETGSHPFDSTEAETEICEGLLTEYSGAPLGVFKLSHAVKILTMFSLFIALFFGGINTGSVFVNGLLWLLLAAILSLGMAVLQAVTARLKINQIFKFYWTVVTILAGMALLLAWFGR